MQQWHKYYERAGEIRFVWVRSSGYEMDSRGLVAQFPEMARDLSPKSLERLWGSPNPLFNGY
jgi:hypothetical protein